MARQRKVPQKRAVKDRYPAIRLAAAKRTKADLVDLLVQIARDYPEICPDLEAELNVAKPIDLWLNDMESAICKATDFDDHYLNRNFDYDSIAYQEIERGFKELIKLGYLDEVKELAYRLMESGSYQVECSDEGMMTDEIEACLKPVIRAVAMEDPAEAKLWAGKMMAADRVGFICDKELAELR
jgi:hypothetical protein